MTTPTGMNSASASQSCHGDAGLTREWLAAPLARGCVLAAASLTLDCGPISDARDATGTVVETETIGD